MTTSITRKISIDTGHRVPGHANKCRNLHGHTYIIEATFTCDELVGAGAAEGMVADFGCLKELMLQEIDAYCDHGMVLWINDTLLPTLTNWSRDLLNARRDPETLPMATKGLEGTKLYIVPFVPTAENLARHWAERMQAAVPKFCGEAGVNFRVQQIVVWETPNCFARYIMPVPRLSAADLITHGKVTADGEIVIDKSPQE